ncbi:MAG: type IX secretion system membrane protein PorP/SprF [Bacteroidota bacterium]
MKQTLLLILMTTGVLQVLGQDAQFSQFYANPLYLNPAMVGTSPNSRVGLNHRILWPNLPQAFVSSTASFDYHSEPLQSSFGLMVHQDREGSASLSNTGFYFTYGYELPLSNKLVLRPAVQFGYVTRGFDPTQLVFSDQIDFGLDGAPSQDPNINALELRDYWDFNTGLLIYSEKYWVGFAAHHLTRPNLSLTRAEDPLSIRYSVHAGTRLPLGKKMWRSTSFPSIAPNILYKRQGEFEQLDIGASFHLEPMIFGLYYRGMPFVANRLDQINQDAIIVQVGLEYRNFEFGYSFDMNLSEIDVVTGGGAHEMSLQYRFAMAGRGNKPSRVSRRLPCPAFMRQLPM